MEWWVGLTVHAKQILWSIEVHVCVYHSNVTESVPSAYNQRYNLEITYQKNDVECIGMSQN